MSFEQLYYDKNTDRYQLTQKKNFGESSTTQTLNTYDSQQLIQILEFSWDMTYGAKGEHRSTRTGGKISRKNLNKFGDVIIGKLGELAFYNVFKQRPLIKEISPLDFKCYGLTMWDDADFTIRNIYNHTFQIAVKTTKHIGNLLLLETDDWIIQNGKAIYVPNQQSNNVGHFDYLFFARVKSEINLLIQNDVYNNYSDSELKSYFFRSIKEMHISTEVVGYISNQDLVYIIENKYILPQGSLFGAIIQGMDASNYYVQSGCLRQIKK